MKDTKLITAEFNRLVLGFEQELKKENIDELYISQLKNGVSEFLSYIEANKISTIIGIEQSIINKYFLYMEQERMNLHYGGTLVDTTINSHKCSVRKFWKYLDIEGVQANAILIKQKKKTKQEAVTVLTHEEIQQLYAVCDNSTKGFRDRAMIAIFYGCGMRRSEGQRLVLTDFDFVKGRIHIRKCKNNNERYVMMSPTVQQQIEEYIYSHRDLLLTEQSNQDAFFIGEWGTTLTGHSLTRRLTQLWDKVKDDYVSDKHIGLHTLRHSLGTHLYMAKMDIEMIALMLGHRSLLATQLYIHLTNLLQK